MKQVRIQHIKDVLFTQETLGSKSLIRITQNEAKEFIQLLQDQSLPIVEKEGGKTLEECKDEFARAPEYGYNDWNEMEVVLINGECFDLLSKRWTIVAELYARQYRNKNQ